MIILTVSGINTIFILFLPLKTPYSHYFYWKLDLFEFMARIVQLINYKAHLTFYGFKSIIEIIYSYPYYRSISLNSWLHVIDYGF